jgi:hypothetical protein
MSLAYYKWFKFLFNNATGNGSRHREFITRSYSLGNNCYSDSGRGGIHYISKFAYSPTTVNIRRQCVSRSHFFIQIISKKHRRHYVDDIKPVFLKWNEVDTLPLKNRYSELSNISFPLYMDVTDQIRSKDKFGEALPHLNDKAYERAKKAYNSISSLQHKHNQVVSNTVGKLEASITSTFSDYNIPETPDEYYSLARIIEAFKNTSVSSQSQLILDENMINGISYTDFKLAGITFARSKTDKGITVRRFIDIKLETVIQDMSRIENNIENMKSLINAFNTEIENIIHEANRSGLKGKCCLETRPWKFFRSKSYPADD